MSNPEKATFKALKQAKASLEVEGFKFTNEEEKLIMASLRGEITHDEFLRKVLERANQKHMT